MITHDEFLAALKIVNAYKIQVYDEYKVMEKELSQIDFTPEPVTPETLMCDVEVSARTINILKYIASYYSGTKGLKWTISKCNVRIKHFEGLRRSDIRELRNGGVKTVKEIENLFFQAGIILK
jgi:two-component SAPR family response regulator